MQNAYNKQTQSSKNMKAIRRSRRVAPLAALVLLSTLSSQLSTCLAQGSLTPPPGAPAPVMKSLDEIEPRTAISSAPFIISKPGSYYLTANLTVASGDAITITTNSVTLDLNGFTISSTDATPSDTAILVTEGCNNIRVANGSISSGVYFSGGGYLGAGFGKGIYALAGITNMTVSHVAVSGCRFDGIYLVTNGDATWGSIVESCSVRDVGGRGIFASIVRSSSGRNCGSSGIAANQVSDCLGHSNSSAAGIFGVNVQNSSGFGNSGNGIATATAINCYGESATGVGITASGTASFCRGKRSGGVAISAAIAIGCTVESGTVSAPQKHLGTP